jgi:dTDP-4-dehydrorhamnose 3,5-epimerase
MAAERAGGRRIVMECGGHAGRHGAVENKLSGIRSDGSRAASLSCLCVEDGCLESKLFPIPGPVLFTPPKFGDLRGFNSEVYNQRTFESLIGTVHFVQDNHSLSVQQGTIRGLHFQAQPSAQGKLVRVARGAIFDVAVDIRRSSPTFGRHISAILSAENWSQLWVPIGFAHGFCTIEPNTEVIYKVTDFYSKADDKGIAWNDPDIGIEWPVTPGAAIISERDTAHPRLSESPAYFD